MKSLTHRKSLGRGRPLKDEVLQFRTLLWYWAVKNKSGLSDGKLDIEFSDPEPDGKKRVYADRIRIFEDIRKSGCTISSGNHTYRNFNLIARVNNHKSLKGSAAIYESILWDILSEKQPTLRQTTIDFISLIKICNLSEIEFKVYQPPNEAELIDLSKIINLSPDEIKQLLMPEINSNERKHYDDILQSFSNVVDYHDILKKPEFDCLARYLNILAFYITIYRYTLLKGNFHALIAAADAINEHLSLLLSDMQWLESSFSKGLFHIIYKRVFRNMNKSNELSVENQQLQDEINSASENSALHNLSILFND